MTYKSLTGPAISQIAGGPNNKSLRNFVLLVTFERNKIQMRIKTKQSIIKILYNTVLKDHDKLSREANVIDQQFHHIANQNSHDTRMSWIDICKANVLHTK